MRMKKILMIKMIVMINDDINKKDAVLIIKDDSEDQELDKIDQGPTLSPMW